MYNYMYVCMYVIRTCVCVCVCVCVYIGQHPDQVEDIREAPSRRWRSLASWAASHSALASGMLEHRARGHTQRDVLSSSSSSSSVPRCQIADWRPHPNVKRMALTPAKCHVASPNREQSHAALCTEHSDAPNERGIIKSHAPNIRRSGPERGQQRRDISNRF